MTQAQPNNLPAQPEQAMQLLCKLSQSLIDLAEQESQALIQKDMLAFAILQDEKERLSKNYLGASQEFRTRLNEFRRLDKSIIGRLEKLQNNLGERTNDNNKLIAQIKAQAERNTQHSMLIAQEYADSPRSTFSSPLGDMTKTAGGSTDA